MEFTDKEKLCGISGRFGLNISIYKEEEKVDTGILGISLSEIDRVTIQEQLNHNPMYLSETTIDELNNFTELHGLPPIQESPPKEEFTACLVGDDQRIFMVGNKHTVCEIEPHGKPINCGKDGKGNTEFDFDKLIQLTPATAKELRIELYHKNKGICPLLGIEIDIEDAALDHKHKRKADPSGPNGDGLVRDTLSFRANSLEGKITNAWKRQFGYDEAKHPITLPNFLRNLANYLERPVVEPYYVHPSEKIKIPKLPISTFNLVKRYWKELYPKRALPKFPKSGKLTEDFKLYIEQFKEFDNKVKDGTYKLLGKRDRTKIALYYNLNPKIKKTDRPYLGKYITEPVRELLEKIYSN